MSNTYKTKNGKNTIGASKAQSLVNSTVDLIMNRGLDNFTLGDIADKTDVDKGNLYYHFKKKDELYEEAIDTIKASGKLKDEFSIFSTRTLKELQELRAALDITIYERVSN